MSKKYDYRKVRSHRAYKLKDACRLYKAEGLHEQTIRGWIKEQGLEAVLQGKTYFIHGGVLKAFLKEKSEKRNRPLTVGQFKCWACKAVGSPVGNIISRLANGRNKSLAGYGDCGSCGKEMERLYKRSQLPKILKTFQVKQNQVGGLCDSSCSTRKTHINNAPKTPQHEPEKYKPPDTSIENANSTKKTNINDKQYNLFEG